MSFREKSAWVMVAILLVAGVSYFLPVVKETLALGYIAPPSSGAVIAYVVFLVTNAVLGEIIITALSRKGEDARDERDRLIAARAGSVFGTLLVIGIVWFMGMYLFAPQYWGPNGGGDLLFQGALASMMLAQIGEYGVQIWLYWRGE